MATAKKKPAARQQSTRKKTPAKRQPASRSRKAAAQQASIARPATGLVLLAVGIVLFFCVVTPTNAPAIVAVRGFVNGTFGKLGIIATLLTAYVGLQVAFGERWPVQRVLSVQLVLLTFCLATLLQVFRMDDMLRALRAEGYVQNYNGFLWKSYDAAKNVPVGGGALGALLAYPMGTYLDVWGSALILFIALFGVGFWLVHTMVPSAGERVAGLFDSLRLDMEDRREERRAEKEARREAEAALMANPANDALLVTLPEELMQGDELEETAPQTRVAKGRKKAKPAPPPVQYEQIDMDTYVSAPAASPYQRPKAVEPRPRAVEPPPEYEPPVEPRPAPRQRPRPNTRLYIEHNAPARRTAPEDAYTEYDVERFKYATRPSRKDPNALPEFVLKRRALYDETYGQSLPGQEMPIEAEVADEPAWNGEPIEEEIYYDAEPEPEVLRYEEEPAPKPRAPRKREQPVNHLDRQPQLDPETRLDRPDWKPPEPEIVEAEPDPDEYRQPPFSLLIRDESRTKLDTREADAIGAQKLEETLASFGVSAHVTKVVHGPAITRYELQPAPGVKVSKIVNLTDDIALNMAALGVRIEAPIPGKAAIGIELANEEVQTVHLRDVLESDESLRNPSKLAVALGKDIAGKRIIADLARMPHLLIAGATGSGKSVCINTIITSIIYRATPEEVRLILIDPKKVELAVYNGIPHLLVPVVTDPKKASGALAWAVMEMDERYKLFAEIGVRDIKGYNSHRDDDAPLMPQIVVIIDELSDLMLVAPGEVEESICRLAQLARACGIHLVVATQRPSVNVITGIIKANVPSRIAFAVSSQVDSRTILDGAGAEKLLGKGDMLFAPSGGGKPQRVQGCFVSDDEVARVVEYVKDATTTDYSEAVIAALEATEDASVPSDEQGDDSGDALFADAVEIAIESGQASISMLQRRLRVGYARAGRLVDEMTRRGIISAAEGAKPREVLISREEYRVMFGK